MRLTFFSEALIQNLNLLSQKLRVLRLRAVLGLFLGPLGAAHGGILCRAASTIWLSFLQEALLQNLNLLSQKLWVLWLRAVLGRFSGPLGAAHGGVLGQAASIIWLSFL